MSDNAFAIDERGGRRGRPRPEDLADRDRRVDAAAWAVFSAQGYGRATIDEIARRAGVAKRTLYGVYGGKSGLFERVVRSVSDPAAQGSAFDHLPDAAAVLLAVVMKAVANKVEAGAPENRSVDLMRMIIAEAPSQPDLVSQVRSAGRQQVIQSVAGVFERLFARGLLAPRADPHAAAVLFVDMVMGAGSMHGLCYVEEDLTPFLERLVAFFVAGYPAWAKINAPRQDPAGAR